MGKIVGLEKFNPHAFTGRSLIILHDGRPHNGACFNQDDPDIPEKTIRNVHGTEMVSLQARIGISYLNPHESEVKACNALNQEVPFAVSNIVQAVDIHVRAGHGGH